MVNYSSARNILIENVECEIHILGVQPSGILLGFATLVVVFVIFPPVAPFGFIATGALNRFLFMREQSGRPITFHRNFLAFIKKFPLLRMLFPSLEGVVLSDGRYYGNK